MPKTVCRRELLMLLVWQFLFTLTRQLLTSHRELLMQDTYHLLNLVYVFFASSVGSYMLAPFFGWLADVKLGRYKVIMYGVLASFATNVLFFIGLPALTGKVFGMVVSCIAIVIESICYASLSAALLPFMIDQFIGATANELSAVVYWYYWSQAFGEFSTQLILCNPVPLSMLLPASCAACFAVIIISDCLCQQWLDRTHKITNPIKLIIQVLNYARKNKYPRRRSAFTYMDEEQPLRLDFGKEKFGGPFTEEEVEDVKTVLRLLPLIGCISVSVSAVWLLQDLDAFDNDYINCVLDDGLLNWLFPLLLIPLCQLLYPFFHKWVPSMLRRIGAGLFLHLVGFALYTASFVYGYAHSSDFTNYLTCTAVTTTVTWYWKLAPLLLFGISQALVSILLLEFTIAQSPDKMKGLVIGVVLAFTGIGKCIYLILSKFLPNTVCYDVLVHTILTVSFLVFLFLSKQYKLRERNREVNIQAIVEEHYERYMDQEEEYLREQQLQYAGLYTPDTR